MLSIFVLRVKDAKGNVPFRLIWRLIKLNFSLIITRDVCGHAMPTLLATSISSHGSLQLRPLWLIFSLRRLAWQRSRSQSPECRDKEEFPHSLRKASLHGFIVGGN